MAEGCPHFLCALCHGVVAVDALRRQWGCLAESAASLPGFPWCWSSKEMMAWQCLQAVCCLFLPRQSHQAWRAGICGKRQ